VHFDNFQSRLFKQLTNKLGRLFHASSSYRIIFTPVWLNDFHHMVVPLPYYQVKCIDIVKLHVKELINWSVLYYADDK